MNTTNGKATQLAYLCCLFRAINESCKKMNNITYLSGGSGRDDDRDLDDFQVFLCKLAQICDKEKGGDTITALVALKDADGPKYLFASNDRSEKQLQRTGNFLRGLLNYVGTNPDHRDEKPTQKKVLWRILEFNFPRVDFYLRQLIAQTSECIKQCEDGSNLHQSLVDMGAKAEFPRDIRASDNAKTKFLRDCETLIKAVHVAKENGVSEAISRRAGEGNVGTSPWCDLRHYLGRLHSFRQASRSIVRASKVWPELFKGFTVDFITSSSYLKHPKPKQSPSILDVVDAAFPGSNLEEYHDQFENLLRHNLNGYIQDDFPCKPIKQYVHCEVHLADFLVSHQKVESSAYWQNSMFIATSKPPCRLCHFYFEDHDNDFQVRSSHMNVYPKWRLPNIGEDQEAEAHKRRDELLEEIIEKMQDATLDIIRKQYPQGQRNDSRTESRGLSTRNGFYNGESRSARASSWIYEIDERSALGWSAGGQAPESGITAGIYDVVGAAI